MDGLALGPRLYRPMVLSASSPEPLGPYRQQRTLLVMHRRSRSTVRPLGRQAFVAIADKDAPALGRGAGNPLDIESPSCMLGNQHSITIRESLGPSCFDRTVQRLDDETSEGSAAAEHRLLGTGTGPDLAFLFVLRATEGGGVASMRYVSMEEPPHF